MPKVKKTDPFDGFPTTRILAVADGTRAYEIDARVLTPLRARLADTAGLITASGMAIGAFAVAPVALAHWWAPAAAAALSFLSFPAHQWLCRRLFKRTARIALSEVQLAIRRWWGWECFDRTLPHTFAAQPHDHARSEKKAAELRAALARSEGDIISPTEYCSASFHIALEHVGQRRVLLTVLGLIEARAILARLKACDAALDANAHKGEGIALGPQEEWGEEPGQVRARSGRLPPRHLGRK